MFWTRGAHGDRTYLVEHVLQALLSQCRTLDVLNSPEFPSKSLALLRGNGSLLLPLQLLHDLWVVPQIYLGSHDKAWYARTVVMDFREPLFLDVLKGGRRGYAKAHEEDVGLRV